MTTQVFCCNQQTAGAQTKLTEWLGGQPSGDTKIRYSMPPFNRPREGVELPTGHELFEVPVYGLSISAAIMECFELPGVKDLAEKLDVLIPPYKVSTFVQKKMFKVQTLIDVATKREDCQEGSANAAAIGRLQGFKNEFAALKEDEVSGPDAWHQFVCRFTVSEDWLSKLEFKALLSNFGFEAQTAKEIGETMIDDDGKQVALEQYSLRWLGKGLAGYNVVGCLTDVANLLFAMANHTRPRDQPPPKEMEIVETIKAVTSKLKAAAWADLWIPTHMMHDAETDDQLAWLLLEHVHQHRGTKIQVLVQLPTPNAEFPELEAVERHYNQKDKGTQVFRDPESRNAEAIKSAFPPKFTAAAQ